MQIANQQALGGVAINQFDVFCQGLRDLDLDVVCNASNHPDFYEAYQQLDENVYYDVLGNLFIDLLSEDFNDQSDALLIVGFLLDKEIQMNLGQNGLYQDFLSTLLWAIDNADDNEIAADVFNLMMNEEYIDKALDNLENCIEYFLTQDGEELSEEEKGEYLDIIYDIEDLILELREELKKAEHEAEEEVRIDMDSPSSSPETVFDKSDRLVGQGQGLG
jgi:hypothetical protein